MFSSKNIKIWNILIIRFIDDTQTHSSSLTIRRSPTNIFIKICRIIWEVLHLV